MEDHRGHRLYKQEEDLPEKSAQYYLIIFVIEDCGKMLHLRGHVLDKLESALFDSEIEYGAIGVVISDSEEFLRFKMSYFVKKRRVVIGVEKGDEVRLRSETGVSLGDERFESLHY